MINNRVNSFLRNVTENPLYQYGILTAIILLATSLRFFKLGFWSMWIDEIFTINRAQIHFSDPVNLITNLPNTLWLPISVILTEVFLKLFGVSEWSARLASALIGIVSLPLLFFYIRKLFGVGVSLVFVLLLAVSPWHLFWSQNARFYTSLMLLYALAALFFYLGIERNRPIYFVVFYVIFYFAFSERLVAAFIFPTIFTFIFCIWIFRFDLPRGLNKRNSIIFLAPLFFMVLLEIIRFLISGSSMTSFFIQDFGGQQSDDPVRLLVSIVFNIGLPIISLGLTAGVYYCVKKNRAGLFMFIAATLPVILIVLLNPVMFTKDRYVFVTLPFWLLLASLFLIQIASQIQGLGKILAVSLLIVLLAEAAGSAVLYYHVNNGNRRDWRAAFDTVKSMRQSNDEVVAWWPEFGPFYLSDKEILPYKDVLVDDVMESQKRYWFIIDSETVWGNLSLKYWIEKNGQLINIFYLRLPEDDFNLKVYLYDPAMAPAGK